MRMMLGDYCLAIVREADHNGRESEGFYWCQPGDLGFCRLPGGYDLGKAKAILLDTIPEPCRPFIVWEGEP